MPPSHRTRTLRYSCLGATCLLLVAASGLLGYFLGFRNGEMLVARNSHATSAMILSAIHQRIEEGDPDAAKSIASSFATCEIRAYQATETESLAVTFWSMLPFTAPFDQAKVRQNYLHQAFTHFSRHPDALSPEAMSYLRKVGSQEPPMPSQPSPK